MKKLAILNLSIILSLVLGSCSTSNNVVNNRSISKRKYTKGFHINKKSNLKSSKDEIATKDYHVQSNETTSTVRNSGNIASVTTNRTEARRSTDRIDNGSMEENEISSSSVDQSDQSNVNNQREVDSETSEPSSSATKKSSSSKKKEQKKKKENRQGSGSDTIFILAVIFAILIPPLGVAIYTNIDWMKVLIALLLTILFFLPGMIYALLVVFDVI